MAAKPRVIRTVSDVTVEWLTDVLKTPIESFDAQRIGTGQVSDCIRLTLKYPSEQPTGPLSVILKIAASDPTSRQTGIALGIYEKEVRFYAEIAPSIGGPLAKCYHAVYDDEFFSILLGDATPAVVGDDIEGATIEQARLAMAALGSLHGPPLRGNLPKGTEWIRAPSRINQTIFQQLFMGYAHRYRDRLSKENLEICQRLVESFDAHSEAQRSDKIVHGLVHGDYRLDNMLFGEQGADKPLTVVDWQTVSFGPALGDAAYFLGSSLPIETRRAHFDELVQLYHSALGPDAPLTLEQCKLGIRDQSFFGIVMGIASPMLVVQTDRGDDMFMAMMERHCAQVRDLNALDILPKVVALQPLRPNPEDEHLHPKGDDALWNESWYFDMVDEKQGIGAYVRLGAMLNQKGSWYTAVVTLPNKSCISVTDYQAPHPQEDLVVKTESLHATQTALNPLKEYRVTLNGKGESYLDPAAILRGERGNKTDVQLDLVWRTDGEPYQWRLTSRYEIPCAVSGTISVNDESFHFNNVPAQRDHSWGARDWWGADWMWCAFHLEDGTRIHGADLRIPGRPRMSVGYIQGPEKPIAELTTCQSEEKMLPDGLPMRASVAIKSDNGADFTVEVEPIGHGPLRLDAEDGRVAYFTRAWTKLKASDGRTGVGWIEWNHQQK